MTRIEVCFPNCTINKLIGTFSHCQTWNWVLLSSFNLKTFNTPYMVGTGVCGCVYSDVSFRLRGTFHFANILLYPQTWLQDMNWCLFFPIRTINKPRGIFSHWKYIFVPVDMITQHGLRFKRNKHWCRLKWWLLFSGCLVAKWLKCTGSFSLEV